VYDLQVEEGTKFWSSYGGSLAGDDDRVPDSRGSLPSLPSSKESADIYRFTSEYLRSEGYGHYEVSSYALEGRESRHNGMYWGYGSSWVGVGMGATSCVGGRRTARPTRMEEWVRWVEEGGWREEVRGSEGSEQA